MLKTERRWIVIACLALAVSLGLTGAAGAVSISYVTSTGQTATVDYSFISGTQLQLIATETTPAGASALTGAGAILTSVGFLLPGSSVFVLPGTVTINVGSASVGFDENGPTPALDFGAGTDVSGEFGATIGGEKPIGNGSNYDFVSANTSQVTQFVGLNRDGQIEMDGPQGGLLDDSAARGGLGVIDNSVIIILNLDAALSAAQQTAFLTSLQSNSIVEYGSDAAFGTPVPEPATLLLLGSGLAGLGFFGRKRRKDDDPKA